MNTVILSFYDTFYGAILVKDSANSKAVTEKSDFNIPRLLLCGKPDFDLFDFFENLFEEKIDRIITIDDSDLKHVAVKVAGYGNEDFIFHNDGTVRIKRYPTEIDE
nr:MAG TPA: hypothetical protein [Caudoviricetes sp.]